MYSFIVFLLADVLADVESAADRLEDNLRDKLVPIKARDIETVKKIAQDGENCF